jgi:hypothetical protein
VDHRSLQHKGGAIILKSSLITFYGGSDTNGESWYESDLGLCYFVLMEKVQSSKFEVEKFNGKNNFELWKLKMWDLLVQQGLQKALVGKSKKPNNMSNEDWEDLDARALSTIRLCLADEVLFNIVGEETTTGLWSKMESLYMTNP